AAPTIAHPQRPTRPLVPSIAAHAPLSSRGLGRRPLTAETRVRIPVAVLTEPPLWTGSRRDVVLRNRTAACGQTRLLADASVYSGQWGYWAAMSQENVEISRTPRRRRGRPPWRLSGGADRPARR